ncbi:MAG: LysR substrate-binding domain-containing protein [Alphaproteobacteria bacterium]|nr:LysR substrate-binding domain-containing protein [Alphaproteobacteria bacterium]
MRALPYLNGIRAFEATARAGSFAGAGQELGVSPAAISRMVKLLEERLGVVLFQRRANRLVATESGRTYANGIGRLFDEMEQLTQSIRQQVAQRVLTVGVGPTFAVRWLIPRLAEFQRLAPDIEVRITAGGMRTLFRDDWSCGIQLGDGNWPGLQAERLFPADLTPVCTSASACGLRNPNDLRPGHLLRVSHAETDWPLWFSAAKAPDPGAAGPVFDTYGQALQAASDGLGVALGIRPYIDDDLAAGRLTAPFEISVPKGMHWYLVHRSDNPVDSSFTIFRDWIRTVIQPSDAGRPAAIA